MAKKTSRVRPVQDIKPGADPHSGSKNLGKLLGPACFLMFIIFEHLWLSIFACTLVFMILFVLQVFFEKSSSWYNTPYLYATIATALLAYVEYSTNLITNILKLG